MVAWLFTFMCVSVHILPIYLCSWLAVVTMAVLYNAIIIIVRETFDHFHDVLLPLWLLLDYIADGIYIMDMLVQFFTSK